MGLWRHQHLGDEPRRKKQQIKRGKTHTLGDLENVRVLRAGATAGWGGCGQRSGHVRCAAPAWTAFNCGYFLCKILQLLIVHSIPELNFNHQIQMEQILKT